MKRRGLLPFLLLGAIFAGCQSEDFMEPDVEVEGSTDDTTIEKIIINASSGSSSRVSFDDQTDGEANAIVLTWQNGTTVDSFSLYNKDGDYAGDFQYIGEDGLSTGEFEQVTAFEMSDGEVYTAVIPAVSSTDYPTLTSRNAALNGSASKTISDVEDLEYLNGVVKMSAQLTYSASEDNSIAFEHEVAVLKVSVTMPEGVIPSAIAFTDGLNDSTQSLTLPVLTSNTVKVFMTAQSSESDVERAITFEVTDTNGNLYIYSNTTTVAFAAGKSYNATITLKESHLDKGTDYYSEGYKAANGVTYSSETSSVELLTASTTISSAGVYFLDPASDDVVYTISNASFKNLVLIGRYASSKPKVVPASNISFAIKTNDTDGIIMKNVDFTAYSSNYTFKYNGSETYCGASGYWIFDDCDITTGSDQNFSYCNDTYAKSSIENIVFTNNKINVVATADTTSVNLIFLNTAVTADMTSVEFSNNVVYSSGDAYVYGTVLNVVPTTASDMKVTLKNNSFINFFATNASLYLPDAASVTVDKNIFWADADVATNTNVVRFTGSDVAATITIEDNKAYGLTSSNYWRYYNSSSTYPKTDGSVPSTSFSKESSNPFSTFDKSTGTFIPVDTSYGSTVR